jgi:antitoxin component YwqK of YwqJK toxin-antitoxin module
LLALLAAACGLASCGNEVDAQYEPVNDESAFEVVDDERASEGLSPSQDRVVLRYANGAKQSEGRWVAQRKEGEWIHWREDGSARWQGVFEAGVLHGPERGWHANGQLAFEGQRERGSRAGLFRSWYENGTLELEAEYVGGELHGAVRRFNLDGQLLPESSGRFEGGRKVGEL